MMGIYQIRIGPVYYVGQTTSMAYRLGSHLRNLKGGKHPNPVMQSAYDQYGEATFDVLEVVTARGSLIYKELRWIKYQIDTGKWLANKDGHGRSYNLAA